MAWRTFVPRVLRYSALFLLAAAAGEGACAEPIESRIVQENALAGSPASEWDVDGAGDPSIQGFATDISIDRGTKIDFKIRTDAAAYRIDIYRLGYYSGAGARRVAVVAPSVSLPQAQPECLMQADTGLIDCSNWQVSASWTAPSDATSGVYIGRLVRADTQGASHVMFIVRDDRSTSDLFVQTSDTTWQAYNDFGGNSLYSGAPANRAYKVSYNRPLVVRGNQYRRASFWANEYPMLRWLEANGYDVTYTTGVDTAQRGTLLKQHKVFVSMGHDEYWSAEQRANVEAARDAGVHLAFFSGNAIFWKTRWESSLADASDDHRVLVSYKETHAGSKIDPSPLATGTWRDPRFSMPNESGKPENALKGSLFVANCCRFDAIVVSREQARARFWRHTGLQELTADGKPAAVGVSTVGYEWDGDVDNGFRPPGLVRLSETHLDIDSRLLDFGSSFGLGSVTHSITLYKHSSGAQVFATGTILWGWALDAAHDDPDNKKAPIDTRLQQATVNIFADMSVRPASPQRDLVVSEPSRDAVGPRAIIEFPAPMQEFMFHRPLRVSGTATDDGGVPMAVEVSTDGGGTWHPASGIRPWTYEYTPRVRGYYPILARAVDDSGNLQPVLTQVIVDISGYGRLAKAALAIFVGLCFITAVILWLRWRRKRSRAAA